MVMYPVPGVENQYTCHYSSGSHGTWELASTFYVASFETFYYIVLSLQRDKSLPPSPSPKPKPKHPSSVQDYVRTRRRTLPSVHNAIVQIVHIFRGMV